MVRCHARLGGRLGLNSFIQTRQVYTYEIPMGNRVRIIASQTHTRLPNGWRFCPISIPMGTIFVPYPYPNRGIPHGLAGIGSPLTSLLGGRPLYDEVSQDLTFDGVARSEVQLEFNQLLGLICEDAWQSV